MNAARFPLRSRSVLFALSTLTVFLFTGASADAGKSGSLIAWDRMSWRWNASQPADRTMASMRLRHSSNAILQAPSGSASNSRPRLKVVNGCDEETRKRLKQSNFICGLDGQLEAARVIERLSEDKALGRGSGQIVVDIVLNGYERSIRLSGKVGSEETKSLAFKLAKTAMDEAIVRSSYGLVNSIVLDKR